MVHSVYCVSICNIVQFVTHWDGEEWQVENGLVVVKRFISKAKTRNIVFKTVFGKLATWIYANKHTPKDGTKSFLSPARYDSDQLEISSVELKDKVRLNGGSVGLTDMGGSLPKWVWLYSNLSINAGPMDATLDLNDRIVDQDCLGTRGRLKM